MAVNVLIMLLAIYLSEGLKLCSCFISCDTVSTRASN